MAARLLRCGKMAGMKRHKILKTDPEIAAVVLQALSDSEHDRFCLFWFYDYDIKFLREVADRLGCKEIPTESLIRRLRKVVNRLCAVGILWGKVSSCHKEYLGEPVTLKSYQFTDPAYKWRLNPKSGPHYKNPYPPSFELNYLVGRAYPDLD